VTRAPPEMGISEMTLEYHERKAHDWHRKIEFRDCDDKIPPSFHNSVNEVHANKHDHIHSNI
jgi:hypothetical protein